MIIFTTIILMSLTCLGLWLSMHEGHILAWMREPFTKMQKEIEQGNKDAVEHINDEYNKDKDNVRGNMCKHPDLLTIREKRLLSEAREKYESNLEWQTIAYKNELWRISFLKPFVLCVWCFASFWGSLVFWGLHYFYWKDCLTDLIIIWVISVFACTFLNALLDGVLRKLDVL